MKQYIIYIIAILILASCHKEVPTNKCDNRDEQCQYLFIYNDGRYSIRDNDTDYAEEEEIYVMRNALKKMLETYGKEVVSFDQPFILSREDNRWYITGTIPHGIRTGTVHIILDNDCNIISCWHEE